MWLRFIVVSMIVKLTVKRYFSAVTISILKNAAVRATVKSCYGDRIVRVTVMNAIVRTTAVSVNIRTTIMCDRKSYCSECDCKCYCSM